MNTLKFTNINGVPLDINRMKADAPKKVRKAEAPGSYHKGFRVVGLPPGTTEEARIANEKARVMVAMCGTGRMPAPWDAATFQMNAKKKAIRTKAYELRAAADECAALAVKAGWEAVEVLSLTKQ